MHSNACTVGGKMHSNDCTVGGKIHSNACTVGGEMYSNACTVRGEMSCIFRLGRYIYSMVFSEKHLFLSNVSIICFFVSLEIGFLIGHFFYSRNRLY
jgi:hypothetical protein